MQEIDAITTQPSSDDAPTHQSVPSATPPKPEVNTQQPAAGEGQTQQGTDFEYNTQYSLAGGNCLCCIKILSVHVLSELIYISSTKIVCIIMHLYSYEKKNVFF